MSLMPIAPWTEVTPNTYLGAMEAGVSAGQRQQGQDLANRQQDFTEHQATDRLKFAYSQLAGREAMADQMANAKLAAQQRQMQAAQALKESQMDSMSQYHQQQMDIANQRLQMSQQHAADSLKDIQPKLMDIGGRQVIYNPATGSHEFLQPVESASQKVISSATRRLQEQEAAKSLTALEKAKEVWRAADPTEKHDAAVKAIDLEMEYSKRANALTNAPANIALSAPVNPGLPSSPAQPQGGPSPEDADVNAQTMRNFRLSPEAPTDPAGSAAAALSGDQTQNSVEDQARTKENIPEVPRSKAELKKGQKYNTKFGVATWDGTQFIQE